MNSYLISEEIDRLASMADIAGIEYHIFCSKVELDAKVVPVQPLVDTIVWKTIEEFPNYRVSNEGEVLSKAKMNILKPSNNKGYRQVVLAEKKIRKTFKIHILVARAHVDNPNGLLCIDHIDHNRSNNCVSNLRWCSYSQNGMNMSKQSNTSSKYKGVHWHIQHNKWCVSIRLDGKLKHIGYFESEVQAALAYNNFAITHFKKFACLNVSPPENVIDM